MTPELSRRLAAAKPYMMEQWAKETSYPKASAKWSDLVSNIPKGSDFKDMSKEVQQMVENYEASKA